MLKESGIDQSKRANYQANGWRKVRGGSKVGIKDQASRTGKQKDGTWAKWIIETDEKPEYSTGVER